MMMIMMMIIMMMIMMMIIMTMIMIDSKSQEINGHFQNYCTFKSMTKYEIKNTWYLRYEATAFSSSPTPSYSCPMRQ